MKANQSTFVLGEPELGLLHRVHTRADSRRHCFEGGPHFWRLSDVLCPIGHCHFILAGNGYDC